MKVTVFDVRDGQVVASIDPDPEMIEESHWNGKPLRGVRIHHVEDRGAIEVQLVEIAAGGNFVMHSSPKFAFCQIVRGAGTLGLPGGRHLDYRGPETYVFHPDTDHDWHNVTEDTLLAVVIVPDHDVYLPGIQ